jgi:hypothetical protein
MGAMKEVIQNLWKGYGELARVEKNGTTVIVKEIEFPCAPHPRKVKSYQVEMNFYQNYSLHRKNAYTPKLFSGKLTPNGFRLEMEDLTSQGFQAQKRIDFSQVKLCLKWLAKFHQTYLGKEADSLWNIGTYWHLKTRPDELKKISQEDQHLAVLIDEKLNQCPFKTIIHGDAKLSNFLLKKETVAAVDFQYTGGGVGVKDLAYFLSSVYDSFELFEMEEKCLSFYFNELNNKDIEKEWRELYPYAWADFYRFLMGWNPKHYKMNEYIKHQYQKVCDELE